MLGTSILDGKRSSLHKTYKTQPEANEKVWLLNENTEKGSGYVGYVLRAPLSQPTRTSATVDKRFEVEFDQVEILAERAAEAQREADQATAQLTSTRNGYRTLVDAFDEGEVDVKHGLQGVVCVVML